jgi:hypothetical protein
VLVAERLHGRRGAGLLAELAGGGLVGFSYWMPNGTPLLKDGLPVFGDVIGGYVDSRIVTAALPNGNVVIAFDQGNLTDDTNKLVVTSSTITLGTSVVAGVEQASADGNTLVVPSGYTLFFISHGSESASFGVTLPSSPTTGQLLFVRNDSNFAAVCSDGDGTSVLSKTGRLFAGLGGAWVPLL